jgi:hypothetical protein
VIFGSELSHTQEGVGESGARWVKMEGAFSAPGIPVRRGLCRAISGHGPMRWRS